MLIGRLLGIHQVAIELVIVKEPLLVFQNLLHIQSPGCRGAEVEDVLFLQELMETLENHFLCLPLLSPVLLLFGRGLSSPFRWVSLEGGGGCSLGCRCLVVRGLLDDAALDGGGSSWTVALGWRTVLVPAEGATLLLRRPRMLPLLGRLKLLLLLRKLLERLLLIG